MGIEWIIAAIVGFVATVCGTYFSAKRIGAAEQRSERASEAASRIVDANNKATEAQLKVSETSSKVDNEVLSNSPGGAIDELRNNYQRD